MFHTILLATALQRWDRYTAYAHAARDVVAALARGAKRLHVLSVYDYEIPRIPVGALPGDAGARLREHEIARTDALMAQKIQEYAAPLVAQGLPVATLLRVGSPRHLIVEVATEVGADLVVIGSHSRQGLFDIPLGGTARHVSTHTPCVVVMVSPKK